MSSKNGYPTPGRQEVPVHEIMSDFYFLTDEQWEKDRTSSGFDYVIIGSSFCALGFTHRMLQNNPNAKVLIIERGTYFHPDHFQNIPLVYAKTVAGKSETFHWSITKETHEGIFGYQRGMNNFFGGRSSFWSAYCPEPIDDEMAGWPPEVMAKVHEYFPTAKKLLNVVPANEIFANEKDPRKKIFGELQDSLYNSVVDAPKRLDAITRVMHSPLAVKADQYRYISLGMRGGCGLLVGRVVCISRASLICSRNS